MNRQLLIPVKDTQDAANAIARVPQVAELGDEVVVLIVSEVPEAELIGSTPPPTVMDPLATTGGVSSEPRAGDDRPAFIGREELMEIKGRDLCSALDPQIAGLHDRGYGARVEAVFSDEPGATILDYAGDLEASDVYVTPDFHANLEEPARDVVKTL